jgi:hypothetical protein
VNAFDAETASETEAGTEAAFEADTPLQTQSPYEPEAEPASARPSAPEADSPQAEEEPEETAAGETAFEPDEEVISTDALAPEPEPEAEEQPAVETASEAPGSIGGAEAAEEEEDVLELMTNAASTAVESGAELLLEPEGADEPPSWAQILQDCQFLARAQGGMLMDSKGGVIAHCGDWPTGRMDAIAARVMPAVEKIYKTQPSGPLSVRFGGPSLTAWRVPFEEDVLTVAFLSDAPLRAEVRAEIDAELRRGRL